MEIYYGGEYIITIHFKGAGMKQKCSWAKYPKMSPKSVQ